MFISLGAGRHIDPHDISLVTDYDGAISKTHINILKERGRYIDLTGGKKLRSIIITKQGYAIASDIKSETILFRIRNVAGE